MEPIPLYLKYNMYAYYTSKNHIIFDENLSYLLQHHIVPLKITNTHTRFFYS